MPLIGSVGPLSNALQNVVAMTMRYYLLSFGSTHTSIKLQYSILTSLQWSINHHLHLSCLFLGPPWHHSHNQLHATMVPLMVVAAPRVVDVHTRQSASITMFPKLPLALAFLLSAAILAAAELHTETPYYMAPYIWAIGGGVAPVPLGNEECPSGVTLTPEVLRGVPIVFSALHSPGKRVVIDENMDVLIRFNASVEGCHLTTWGNRFFVPTPKTLPIKLLGPFTVLIYEPIYFKVKSAGQYYRVYTKKQAEEGIAEYDLTIYHNEADHIFRRLAITKEETHLLFDFHEAKDYNRMIESVV